MRSSLLSKKHRELHQETDLYRLIKMIINKTMTRKKRLKEVQIIKSKIINHKFYQV